MQNQNNKEITMKKKSNKWREMTNYSEDQYLCLSELGIPYPDEWDDFYYEDHPEDSKGEDD